MNLKTVVCKRIQNKKPCNCKKQFLESNELLIMNQDLLILFQITTEHTVKTRKISDNLFFPSNDLGILLHPELAFVILSDAGEYQLLDLELLHFFSFYTHLLFA